MVCCATGPEDQEKTLMKKFTIEVSHATPQQLGTIALELKIMSNEWSRHGPRIMIDGQKLQAPRLREPRTKRQALSVHHKVNTIK